MLNKVKRLTDAERCCRIIETLVSDDLCEDIEFRIGVHSDYKITKKEAELINKKLTLIYEFAHATNKHLCQASHKSWLESMRKTYTAMKKRGEF